MSELIFRCSSLGDLMTNPRKKTETLSETAKSLVKQMVKKKLFNYHIDIQSKYFDKGNAVENDSVELYNEVHFTNYEKNSERLTNEYITGECDIDTLTKIIDIKSPWSKDTFPATPEDGIDKKYEWQLRGYMWLWGREESELAYCLTNTPEFLLEWENNLSIHVVEDVDPILRVTKLHFKRDKDIEKEIIERIKAARKFGKEYEQKILNKR